MPAAGGPAAHTFTIERDLRDVIVGPGSLAVTKFRSAEVLRIAGDGSILRRDPLPSPQPSFAAHVAWRAVAGPSGSLFAVHQAESTTSVVTTEQGGYGGAVGAARPAARWPPPWPIPRLPRRRSTPPHRSGPRRSSDGGPVPPEDATPDSAEDASPPVIDAGSEGAVHVDAATVGATSTPGPVIPPANPSSCLGAQPANGAPRTGFFQQVPVGPAPDQCLPSGIVLGVLTALGPDGSVQVNAQFPGVLPLDVALSSDGGTVAAVAPGNAFTSGLDTVFVFTACGLALESRPILARDGTSEQPIAVAFDGAGHLLVQTREPAELRIYGAASPAVTVALSSVSRADTGHDIFHTQAGAIIACASCHPEGRDDGHVWMLDGNHRRTPSLLGTIAGTAPYHWPGDEANMNTLVKDVYTVRMNGDSLPPDQMGALTGWVQTVPAPPPPASSDSTAVTHGKALFERADVGCATCHSGPKFTNDQTVDVGTGGSFQVPPLVGVGWRTPLMHDGCAATIADRFSRCSTAKHGSIGSLSPGDISDLTAYLETL